LPFSREAMREGNAPEVARRKKVNININNDDDNNNGSGAEEATADFDRWPLAVVRGCRADIYACSVELLEPSESETGSGSTGSEAALLFRVVGRGFLFNQIRYMAGALMAVAGGSLSVNSVALALRSNIALRLPLAPACGLCLRSQGFAFTNQLPGAPVLAVTSAQARALHGPQAQAEGCVVLEACLEGAVFVSSLGLEQNKDASEAFYATRVAPAIAAAWAEVLNPASASGAAIGRDAPPPPRSRQMSAEQGSHGFAAAGRGTARHGQEVVHGSENGSDNGASPTSVLRRDARLWRGQLGEGGLGGSADPSSVAGAWRTALAGGLLAELLAAERAGNHAETDAETDADYAQGGDAKCYADDNANDADDDARGSAEPWAEKRRVFLAAVRRGERTDPLSSSRFFPPRFRAALLANIQELPGAKTQQLFERLGQWVLEAAPEASTKELLD
jgi:hypothetical protein